MSLPEAARGSQFAPRGVPADPCYAGRLVSAVEAQPDLARQLVRIMRLALEEIAAHQCLDRSAEGDTCAEGDECAVCLATVALQDVDTEERAESLLLPSCLFCGSVEVGERHAAEVARPSMAFRTTTPDLAVFRCFRTLTHRLPPWCVNRI